MPRFRSEVIGNCARQESRFCSNSIRLVEPYRQNNRSAIIDDPLSRSGVYSQCCIVRASCKKPASYATCWPKVGYPGHAATGGARTRPGATYSPTTQQEGQGRHVMVG